MKLEGKMSNNTWEKFFYLFIILQPVLDVLTSIMSRNMEISLTVGIVSRSLFMAYMFIYALFIHKSKGKVYKYSKIILIGIGLYIIVFLGHMLLNKEVVSIITEVKGIIKLFYFPIVLSGIFIFNEKHKIDISNKFLTYLLLGYTGVIFIATITGTYFRSYNEYIYGLGTVGWFFAANEIGSIIAILTPFTVINIIQNRLNILNFISILLCILSTLYMGTKVPFIGFIGVLAILFIYLLVVFILSRVKNIKGLLNYKKIVISIVSISFGFCLLFYNSPIYKNILFNYGHIIQKIVNNGDKSKDEPVKDQDNGAVNDIVTEETEQKLEINMHVNQDDVVASLLSNRTVFANEVKEIFKSESTANKFIGLGHTIQIREDVYTDKTIEMDHLDILYRHGIIGFILYFAQMVLILGLIIKSLFKGLKCLLDLEIIAYIISIILGVSIALVSGHVLTAPGVSIYIIVSLIMLYNKVVNRGDMI